MANDERFIVEDMTDDLRLAENESRPLVFESDSYFDSLNEYRRLSVENAGRDYLLSAAIPTRIRTLESSDRDNVVRVARGLPPILT